MISLNQSLGILQDVLLGIHHAVGRQATILFTQGHRAARCLEPESGLIGGSNFIVQF